MSFKMRLSLILVLMALVLPVNVLWAVQIGIMGPPSPDDEVEQNMYRYLGQRANIDYVLLVNTKEQFFRDLEKIAKDGKKIDYLIIAGHGESREPHIALGTETILPGDIDLSYWNDQLKDMAKRRAEAWREKCLLLRKEKPAPEDPMRIERLSKNIELQERRIKAAVQQMELFDSVSEIMAENAVILLINCSPAATEKGLAFVQNLGRVFLARKGGKVIASTVDVSVDQVTRLAESIRVWLGSSEKTKDAAWKGIGEMFVMGNWKEVNIPGDDLLLQLLPVSVQEPCLMAPQGSSVNVKCQAGGWKDSGKLTYHWNRSPSGTAQPSFILEIQEAVTDLIAVEVLVKDERGRQGTDTAFVSIEPLSLKIDVSDPSPVQNSRVKARAQLVKGKKPDESSWYWKVEGGLKISDKMKEEIDVEISTEGLLTLQLIDTGPFGKTRILGQATARIQPRKDKEKEDSRKEEKEESDKGSTDPVNISFAGTASDVWEGGNYDNGSDRGFHMKRKKASSKGTGECKWEASVDATVWGKIDPSFAPRTEAEILSELNRQVESAKAWGKTAQIRAIAIGDFKGHFMDTSVKFSGGGWSDAGFRADGVSAEGRGFLIKGQRRIELGYNVGGGGCWTNEDRAFLESQARAAQDDAKAILAGLQLVVNGSMAKIPYKGPKLDGSDMPKVTLSPPSLEKLKVGDTVKVTAEVQNDKPEDSPFTYNWGGTFDGKPEDSKKKATITIKPQKPGKYDLSVSVDGQRFNMGGASLQYEVADYKVKIERVPVDTKPVPVSVKTGFKATLTVDGKPASGNFIYRWQPHPEVTFDKLDASTPDVKASFPKPGRVKVWVQVLETRGGRQATVAESEQIEIEVVKPALDLSFDPKEPWVGQELKAKLTVKPEVKEIDFRWMPVPDNARQSMESKDGKEITFYLKDDKQVEIQVNARVPKSGEDLGEAKNTIKAKKYTVNVTGPKAMGPKPRVWKEGVGPVDVEKEIAVDQIVEFAADTQPAALTGPVKYQWTVTSGSCTVSNPTSREARATASAAGGCELTVTIKDKNDVQLGEGKGSFNATITRETIKQGQDKAKNVEDAKTKVQGAKDKVRKGDYDGAIKEAEEAGKLDPASKDAAGMAEKLRKEKETIHQQIDKAKKLMDENKFPDAQKELIVASNLNGTYPPVAAANKELSDRWGKYNASVRDKVYEVRSANEKKEFGKALEIAAAWRASTKLDPYAEKELKQQEDWAKQWKAQKDKQIEILKAAGEKVKAYDYAGALKAYDEGFANGQNIYNGTEPEYKEAFELRNQAFTKNKRLNELIPWVRKAAEDKEYMAVEVLQNTMKTADEAIALQPNNEQLKKWREQIVARAEKTKGDNERISQGRKYLDAAGGAERSFLTNESSIQARQIQWGEQIELQQQQYLTTAIQNYTESLKYIPDANVEKKIKDLQATLEARKKYLENYRFSIALMKEGDALAQAAPREPDFEKSLPMYDQAIEKYRKSLSLYRPVNAEMVEKQMWNLDLYKHERMVKKYWADGQAVEKEGKIIEALAAYDKALASFHSSVPQVDRMWIASHAQDLRNRINGAKTWRADGEAKQKAGKIPEAIASYRQSLKLLPDAALEEHVRMLEGRQAEAGEKKATADRLWQEGTTLFNAKKPSDALVKFKESLGYWQDATRAKYVQDLEGRKTQAERLRSEGASFQSQGQLREAAGKYRESLGYWPDPALADHIAKIEAEIRKQETQVVTQPPTSGSGGVDGTWEVSFNNFRGKMELQRSGSSWSGRLWLDAHQRWEQLTNISYSSAGRLEFTRPISGATQRYSGALSGERFEGTFTQENTSTKFTWWAKKTQAGTDIPNGSDASNASFPLQISRNVPNQNSSAFKQNVRKDLSMDTTSWDKIPYSMHVSSHDLMIAAPAKFCLAGDAGGTKGWSVDNFLLIEILDQSGNLISSALAGLTETVRRNGNPIETIGRSSYSFNACEIDVTKLLPVGRPFRLRASAMDYGGVGYVSDVFIVSSKGTSGAVSQPPSPSPTAKGNVIFNNGNTGGVFNNPSRATTFTLRAPHVITLITNYHWNNGRGATPGTIALRGSDGRTYGSWRTSGSPGQNGVPNANWNASPNVTLPAGTYTVVDSNPATWAQNSESGGAGHTKIEGYPSGQVR